MSDDRNDPFAGIFAAQMIAMASELIVRELMIDVARLHPDPERYLTQLYDRVIAHLELLPPPGGTEKGVYAHARDIVGAQFRDAVNALRNTRKEEP